MIKDDGCAVPSFLKKFIHALPAAIEIMPSQRPEARLHVGRALGKECQSVPGIICTYTNETERLWEDKNNNIIRDGNDTVVRLDM